MRPVDESRFFYGLSVQRVQQQRLQMAAQPVMHGDIESLFLPGEDALRQLVLHQIAQKELQRAALNAVVRRKRGREFDDAMIEEGRTNFERVRHAHSIDFSEQIIRQVVSLIEGHEAADVSASRNGREQLEQVGVVVREHQLTALIVGEGPVPEDVRASFVKQRSMQEALQFVVEANLLVGGPQAVRGAQRQPPDGARNNAGAARVLVGEIGDVAAEELVGAFAAESDRHLSGGHSRQVPDRNGSGVGVGLVGVVGKLGDRFRRDG